MRCIRCVQCAGFILPIELTTNEPETKRNERRAIPYICLSAISFELIVYYFIVSMAYCIACCVLYLLGVSFFE